MQQVSATIAPPLVQFLADCSRVELVDRFIEEEALVTARCKVEEQLAKIA